MWHTYRISWNHSPWLPARHVLRVQLWGKISQQKQEEEAKTGQSSSETFESIGRMVAMEALWDVIVGNVEIALPPSPPQRDSEGRKNGLTVTSVWLAWTLGGHG